MGPRQQFHLGVVMTDFLREMWSEDNGQDIAEYAVMLAAILVIVIGTSPGWLQRQQRLFSVASSIQ